MNSFAFALVLVLPAHVAGGGLRGLALEPLQMPPPPTADAVFYQMAGPAPAASSNGPGPAPGPAPGGMPPEPKIPKITEKSCKELKGKVEKLVGATGGGPAPAPAAALLQGAKDDKPTVECKIYAWVSGKPAGCNCFVETPPPPFKPKVAGCPTVPKALDMGFTGKVLQEGPMAFGGQTGGWTRLTCIYRQWFFDPQATGRALAYQTKLNDARAGKYIKDTYAASLRNAHNTAKAFWALTPVPWLKLYPTTPWPVQAPAPGPAPGPATTQILFANPPPTTPSMFTTPSPFGTTPAAGMTTAPTFAVAR